jgi:hypothetical protein
MTDEKEIQESISQRLIHRRPFSRLDMRDVLLWCNTIMLIYLVIRVYGWI